MHAPRSPQALELLMQDHRTIQTMFIRFGDEDEQDAREAIVREACREIRVHAALEEQLFYPVIQDEIKDPDLVDEAAVEHAAAHQLIGQLDAMTAEDALFEATFKVLGEYLNHHIREEEETLFAEVRRTRMDLEALGVELAARRSRLEEAFDAEETADT